MALAHLVFAAVTTADIIPAIQFEERDLIAEHGSVYEEYRRHVPMLLPVPTGTPQRRAQSAASAIESRWPHLLP